MVIVAQLSKSYKHTHTHTHTHAHTKSLNEWSLWYINCTSIKLFFRNNQKHKAKTDKIRGRNKTISKLGFVGVFFLVPELLIFFLTPYKFSHMFCLLRLPFPSVILSCKLLFKPHIFLFGHICSMRKFPGQWSILCHSSETTRSLTHWATRELQPSYFGSNIPLSKRVHMPSLDSFSSTYHSLYFTLYNDDEEFPAWLSG